jgi:hypothetical protein
MLERKFEGKYLRFIGNVERIHSLKKNIRTDRCGGCAAQAHGDPSR